MLKIFKRLYRGIHHTIISIRGESMTHTPKTTLVFTGLCLLLWAGVGVARPAEKTTLTICTWNIEHLAAENHAGCRPRTNGDYRNIKKFIHSFNADIIAFQEVENIDAALRVFDPSVYHVEISNRPDVALGDCYNNDQQRRMQRTGFAVRKDLPERYGWTFQRMPDVASIACYPSKRWGVHLVLVPLSADTAKGEQSPDRIHFLCVHLQSGCNFDPVIYKNEDLPCSRLARQIPRLEAWVDARAAAGEDFVVMGDFNRQLDGLGDPVWEALDDSEVCEWEQPASGLWHCREGTAQYNTMADLERARAGRRHPYPRNPKYPYSVDHIIMSPGVDSAAIEPSAVFLRDDRHLSDHTPLVMKIKLK